MTTPLRIGVLGCSNIAERMIIPAIIDNPRFALAAVGSRSSEKANAFANRFGGAPTDYDGLLAMDDVDAVYVSLPVGLHAEWGLKAAEAGKHLLMEKTFTDTYASAKAIIDRAAEKNLVCMEALMYLHHPLFSTVKGIVKDGRISAMRSIEAQFGFPMLKGDDIRLNPAIGGGAILDNLIYPLSFCLEMANTPLVSYSAIIEDDDTLGIDTRGHLLLEFERLSAHVTFGFGFMYRNEYTVWGETGYLSANRVFSRPPDFTGDITITTQGNVDSVTVPPANQFSLMLDSFANKIAGIDTSGVNEGERILARMSIIDELLGGGQEDE